MTDSELATMLKDLADTPAPPLRIDVDRARRAGGRRRRARTTALALGCAAVVAAGGATAVAVSRHDAPPAPPAVLPEPAPPAPALAPAPTDNPMVARAKFGWLPEQIKGVEYAVGAHGDTALAIGSGDLPPMIWVSVSDQEPTVPQDVAGRQTRIPVRVGDRDGYWITDDANDPLNHGQTYLRWRTSDGRWAQLLAYYLAVPDLPRVLTRVAAGVTFANRPVPLPLRITSLPDTFRLGDGYLSRRPGQDGVPWRLVLQYSANGALATITVSLPGGRADGPGVPACVTKNGLRACVKVDKAEAAGITSQELLSRITLIGPDEAKWTTHVLSP
ncbi:hypothetical protein ACIRSS_35945 [Amycolatopsis sp. NPDC101161]|uniref:hypothetical protein n=1 Tax=Amycolatopsis sp. NPDC101161 TaxID=3363940 RepID=UPI0037FCCDE0